jgi:phage tail-like protein
MTIPNILQAPLGAPAAVGMRASLPQSPGVSTTPRYGMSMWFQVDVTDPTGKGKSLGLWSKCSGLQVKLDTKEIWSGGDYQAPYLYPVEITYPNVTIERAMDVRSSAEIRTWLQTVASDWIASDEGGAALLPGRAGGTAPDTSAFQGTTVTIRLFSALGATGTEREVATWALRNAIPVQWQGPTLAAKGGDVALETLTLAHRGFLAEPTKKPDATPNTLNSQNQGRLKLSLIGGTGPDDSLEFQYNPTTLTEELVVRKSDEQNRLTLESATGNSFVYNRKNISMADLHVEGVRAVKESYDKLWRWTDSEVSNKDTDTHKVQVLLLQMGSGSNGVVISEHVTIKVVRFEYLRFTSAGVPSRAKLTLTVTSVTQDEADGSSTPALGR